MKLVLTVVLVLLATVQAEKHRHRHGSDSSSSNNSTSNEDRHHGKKHRSSKGGKNKGAIAAPQQLAVNAAMESACDVFGVVASVMDGYDPSRTPAVLKSIRDQLQVAFMIGAQDLENKSVTERALKAMKEQKQILGVRFNSAFDPALNTLTETVVQNQLSLAETQFKNAFGVNLQYILFAYGTPEFATKLARDRGIIPIIYNLDYNNMDPNDASKRQRMLEARIVNPSSQSFISLQSAYTSRGWDVLQDTHNAAYHRGFKSVSLLECKPPLRPATGDAAVKQPQAIKTDAKSAAMGVASVNVAVVVAVVASLTMLLA